MQAAALDVVVLRDKGSGRACANLWFCHQTVDSQLLPQVTCKKGTTGHILDSNTNHYLAGMLHSHNSLLFCYFYS